jgi:hypothetical protein
MEKVTVDENIKKRKLLENHPKYSSIETTNIKIEKKMRYNINPFFNRFL